MDLFDDLGKVKFNDSIRLIELFAGYGSQALALKYLGVKFEHYRVCEFDKYAIKSYNTVHGTNFETSDIRHITGDDLGIVETDKYTYIMTYSFPCQDLSVAGKQKGMTKGEGTRSSLLWEVERLLNETKLLPQILLMENVPQVHGKKNKADFDKWLDFLKSKGYQNFWQDLNAKDFGIPQNRKRCFCVSILSDDFIEFDFPKSQELKLKMKDLLETEVDEKYYINSPKAKELIEKLVVEKKLADGETRETIFMKNMVDKAKEVVAEKIEAAGTLMARDYKGVNNFGMNGVIEW